VTAIIEIPQGSRNKYELDKAQGDRALLPQLQDLEGKRVNANEWGDTDEAKQVIADSIRRYDETYLTAGP
jgi:inorganic pyrophosphatase